MITERLLIEPLSLTDNQFIFELVNSAGWLKFIGNRNVNSEIDATAYIQKIINNPNTTYFVVRLKNQLTEIGVITFIKREYLDHHDIGFAFLPVFANNGYAYEATDAVLKYLIEINNLSHILATTVAENINSIKLLRKLGLSFHKAIKIENLNLQIYRASTSNPDATKPA